MYTTKYIKTVIGDEVAHLKPHKFIIFRQTCNVLFLHYSASSILLSTHWWYSTLQVWRNGEFVRF